MRMKVYEELIGLGLKKLLGEQNGGMVKVENIDMMKVSIGSCFFIITV